MNHFYLIEMQYLGFRYHGWLKQPAQLTIQQTIESALEDFFGSKEFKTLAASRTDSMVSAEQNYFLLMINSELHLENIIAPINLNLPQDIRLLSIKKVSRDFRIIGSAIAKEYNYHFSFGERPHPFVAPTLTYFKEELDIEAMKIAASCFEGVHSFHNFVHQNRRDQFEKKIESAVIEAQDQHWVFKISGKSFMRHQIRLMMGALVKIGNHELSQNELMDLLNAKNLNRQTLLVPATGLVLQRLELDAR